VPLYLNSFFPALQVKKVFEKFMSSLQIFSATFEELKKFRLGEKEEKEEKDRYNIIDNIHTELIRVGTNN